MLGWISSWWSDPFAGPARNAPNGGIDISKLFSQKPVHVITVSQQQILDIKNSLKKTETNITPPISSKPAIMCEFDEVFNLGYKGFFEERKKRKNINVDIKEEKILADSLDFELL